MFIVTDKVVPLKRKMTQDEWFDKEETALQEKQSAYAAMKEALRTTANPLDKLQILRAWRPVNGNAYTNDLPADTIFEELFKGMDYVKTDKGTERHYIIGQLDVYLNYQEDTIQVADKTEYPVVTAVRPYPQIRFEAVKLMKAFIDKGGISTRIQLLSKCLEWDEWHYWRNHKEDGSWTSHDQKTSEKWTHQYRFNPLKRAYWYLFRLIPQSFDKKKIGEVIEFYDKEYGIHLHAEKQYPETKKRRAEMIEETKMFLEQSGLGKLFDEIESDKRFSISYSNLPGRESIHR